MLTAAALGFGAVGFLAGANAAMSTTPSGGSCTPDSAVSAGAHEAPTSQQTTTTATVTGLDANGRVTAGSGTDGRTTVGAAASGGGAQTDINGSVAVNGTPGSGSGLSVRALLNQIKQMSSGATANAKSRIQGLLSQALLALSAKGDVPGAGSSSVDVTAAATNAEANASRTANTSVAGPNASVAVTTPSSGGAASVGDATTASGSVVGLPNVFGIPEVSLPLVGSLALSAQASANG
jgi:hypothetical protein